jgi:sugar phosphate permease
MGIWGTCYQMGGLIATAVATFFLMRWGWSWAFFGPAIIMAAVGLLILFVMPATPVRPRETASASSASAITHDSPDDHLFRNPVIWSLGSAYFFLKLIRYSILFWLPFYLGKVLGYSTAGAGFQSMSFEVGGIIGAITVGALSDRYFPGRRRQIASIMCAALAVSLLLYVQLAPISVFWNFIGMAMVGFCLFGPDTLVSGAAAQDLGGKHNVARAAGFINGMGSIGAIVQGSLTSTLSAYSWNYLFYAFVAMAGASSLALLLGKTKRAAA